MKLEADEEILQDFLLEVDDMCAQLTDLFMKIEADPENEAAISEVYRSFHTIKGGAGFLDLKPVVELCHKIESVFSQVKNKKLILNQSGVDAVLSGYDSVMKMIDEVKGGSYPETEYSHHLSELDAVMNPPAEPEEKTNDNDEKKDSSLDSGNNKKAEDSVENKTKDVEKIKAVEANNPEESDVSLNNTGSADADSSKESKPLDSECEDSKAGDNKTEKPKARDFDFSKAYAVLQGKNMEEEITDEEFVKMLDDVYGKGLGPTDRFDRDQVLSIIKKEKEEKKAAAAKESAAKKESEANKKQEKEKNKTEEKPAAEIKSQSEPVKPSKAKEDVAKEDKKDTKVSSVEKSITQPEAPGASVKLQDKKQEQETKPTPVKSNDTGVASMQSTVDNSIRIDSQRLDEIMNMVGELVLVRNRLVNLKDKTKDNLILDAISNLDIVTSSLQSSVMQTRMKSIKKLFGKFPRIVRDLAKSLNKEVTIEIEGENTELDKSLIDSLSEPLTHLIRNAVDHGLETKQERASVGKNERGHIKLKAEQEGEHAFISIIDDGRGINKNKILEKARSQGIIAKDEQIQDENRVFMLIFEPGFSTADKVTDISGRGVGMDIVRSKIESLNGELQVLSEEGKGTTFKLKLPLTLAILPTLMVSINEHVYAIPLASVTEIINNNTCQTQFVKGEKVIIYRDKTIPVCNLASWFGKGDSSSLNSEIEGHVIIVSDNDRKTALIVDSLVGQEEVMIKPFNELLKEIPGFSGVTITGTGKVAIIIDVPSLIANYFAAKVS